MLIPAGASSGQPSVEHRPPHELVRALPAFDGFALSYWKVCQLGKRDSCCSPYILGVPEVFMGVTGPVFVALATYGSLDGVTPCSVFLVGERDNKEWNKERLGKSDSDAANFLAQYKNKAGKSLLKRKAGGLAGLVSTKLWCVP